MSSNKTPLLGGDGLNLFLRPRPKYELTGEKGKKETIVPKTPDTLVYLNQCEDCDVTLQSVAVKIIIERCSNMVIHVRSRLISGLIEVISSTGVAINIQDDVQVPTITADTVKNIDINITKQDQFESIYSKDCTEFVLHVLGEDAAKHTINAPSYEPIDEQFLTHWKEVDGKRQLVTEKVVRLSDFPTTAEGKAEHEKNKKQMEKGLNEMFSGMIKK